MQTGCLEMQREFSGGMAHGDLMFTVKGHSTLLGDKSKPLYGLLNQYEAYLIPTWLMQEQRLAQVKINQAI